ncbi:flagellin/flagellar hook associated protein [Schinkia azotoformans MEV2011]|uniref:Flagellin n=1 Tax=Schinkia azotoformans MEV2011 TaxID=1348973 RepID=A0A072P4A8_SCHAZ|nr:flagellin [Schinkia azotoformans]KEF40310.1 flagellin/flagellar hook associated protein [Schinkia azotoformans MEV2011]MEC1696382.1 flagellin [Schinkia azotoformans]MEC1715552.1 flagellin [Schinkia azotoformans]MEC1724054.1 flagellin [Schinkia azotoformans]MEC1743438.1 flagellin [Schinkia azotoformans]
MRINHNPVALTAYYNYMKHQSLQQRAMERLSSGLRINRASDDAAGLAISEKMRAQIRGLNQAARNAQDGISLIQTAEGALGETHAILQRVRELTVQAANDTNTASEREVIQNEINQLLDGIQHISETTEFNTRPLLKNKESDRKSKFSLQIGANAGQTMLIEINDMGLDSLGLSKDPNSENYIDVSTHEKATSALERLDGAIKKVSSERSKLGAYQNRLDHTISNLMNTAENLQAAESRIRDADIAKEIMEYTKRSILSQVALAMIAQANQQSQMILKLLT